MCDEEVVARVLVKKTYVEVKHEMLSKLEIIFLHEAKWIGIVSTSL